MSDASIQLIGIIFGSSGAAFLAALFTGISGYNRARRQHMTDLAEWREELSKQVAELNRWIAYWRSTAADYEFQLRSHGIKPVSTATPPITDGDDT